MRLNSLLTEKKEKVEKKGYDQAAANKAKPSAKLEAELKKARDFLDDLKSRLDMGDDMVRQGVIDFAQNWIAGLEVERAQRIGKKK